MKKYLSILLLFVLPLCCFAEKPIEHLKFMGIPLNMTINEFQKKLSAKGITIHPDNKYAEAGLRLFRGNFLGQNASFATYYIPNTKIVYCATAILKPNFFEIDNVIDNISADLEMKYAGYTEKTDLSGTRGYSLAIKNEEGTVYGIISVYEKFLDDRYVYVEYLDLANYAQIKREHLNDL